MSKMKQKLVEKINKRLDNIVENDLGDVTNYNQTIPSFSKGGDIRLGNDRQFIYLKQDGQDTEIKMDYKQGEGLSNVIKKILSYNK